MGREKRPGDRAYDLLFWASVILLAVAMGLAVHVLPFFSQADFF